MLRVFLRSQAARALQVQAWIPPSKRLRAHAALKHTVLPANPAMPANIEHHHAEKWNQRKAAANSIQLNSI